MHGVRVQQGRKQPDAIRQSWPRDREPLTWAGLSSVLPVEAEAEAQKGQTLEPDRNSMNAGTDAPGRQA
jgi:hypothetical protein